MSDDTPFKLEVVAPVFPVTDVGRSVDYYRDALLFEVAFEWADSDDEPVRYAILQNGDTEVHLTEAETARETIAYFFVDSVAGYYAAVKGKGAKITSEIKDYPWEMREFEVADPDGNRLIFGEHLSRIEGTGPSQP